MFFICFLALIKSDDIVISGDGYHSEDVKSGNEITIIQESQKKSILLFPNPNFQFHGTYELESGGTKELRISNEHGICLIGESLKIKKVRFTSTENFLLQVWIIPKDKCVGPLLLYTTQQYLTHYISFEKEVKNMCLFFTNPHQAMFNLYLSTLSKLSSLEVYSGSNVNTKSSYCLKQSCSHDFDDPFFVSLQNVMHLSSFELEIYYTERINTEECEGVMIPTYDGNMTAIYSIQSRTNSIQCTKERSSATSFLIFTSIFGSIFFIIGVLFICGCCKPCQDKMRWLVGPGVGVHNVGFLDELRDLKGNVKIDIPDEDEEEDNENNNEDNKLVENHTNDEVL